MVGDPGTALAEGRAGVLGGGGVPYTHGDVARSRGEAFSVRRPAQAIDGVFMAFEAQVLLSCAGVPHHHRGARAPLMTNETYVEDDGCRHLGRARLDVEMERSRWVWRAAKRPTARRIATVRGALRVRMPRRRWRLPISRRDVAR